MSPKVMTCKQCGRLFQSLGSSNCPACVEEIDNAFKLVKDYLYDNWDATVIDVVNATGVQEKHVLSFIKEGRLDLENHDAGLQCEDCGKFITSGRYCINCRNKLANVLDSAVASKVQKSGDSPGRLSAKMHIRTRRD